MSFFDDVINTTKNAAQTAGKKTDEAVRFTKLKIKESQTSSDIKAHFEKLGQMAYEMKKAENPDAALFDAEIEEIDKLYEKLSEINLLLDDHTTAEQIDPSLSVEALVSYLQNSHSYFLDFRLPLIRRKLIEAIDCGHSDVSFAIMRYFDQYVAEVRKHMNYEETTVFPYVRSLVQGKSGNGKYHIGIFSKQHDQVESRLAELKNIIIKYYPATGSNELNSVLFDIFSCATDLASHNRIEDNLFVPLIAELERKNGCSR